MRWPAPSRPAVRFFELTVTRNPGIVRLQVRAPVEAQGFVDVILHTVGWSADGE